MKRNLILRLRWAADGCIAMRDLPALLREAARELKRLTPKPKPRRLR